MSHLNPTPKKDYTVPLSGMELLHDKYLKYVKCWNLFKIQNKYSVFDYLINSGNSTIVIEVKERYKSVALYDTAILELEKFKNLMKTKELLHSKAALYIMQFTDAILIFDLNIDENFYEWSLVPMQKSEEDKTLVLKPCTFLPYSSATIIGKKEFQRATIDQLQEYIKRERNKLS